MSVSLYVYECERETDLEIKRKRRERGARREKEKRTSKEIGKTETCRSLGRELFILAYSPMIEIIVVEMILTGDRKVYFPEAKQVTSQVT